MFLAVLFLLALLIIGGVFLYQRRRASTGFVSFGDLVRQPADTRVNATPAAARRRSFKAVSIKCGTHPCAAAARLEGMRGLPQQIPKLPLVLCDAEVCHCSYRHHPDRRDSEERRSIYGCLSGPSNLAAGQQSEGNRRAGGDRRLDIFDVDLESGQV